MARVYEALMYKLTFMHLSQFERLVVYDGVRFSLHILSLYKYLYLHL